MPTVLRAAASAVFSPLALVVGVSATLGAAQQPTEKDLPVSLERIREELAQPPSGLKLDRPMELPVATFRTSVEQRVYMVSFEEWLETELEMTDLQRQSADWAARCCGGYVLANGAVGIGLDPLFDRLEKALQRRKVRKIRERIARELAELEAARKKAGVTDER